MQYPWLLDRSGAIEPLLGLATTVKEAGSLLRYILTAGQLLVHENGTRGLVELGELAVLMSISLESQRGVDVQARYADLDDLGPGSTHYGVAILAAFDDCKTEELHWCQRLQMRGLVVEHFWLEDAEPLDYTLELGYSFSRRAAVARPEPAVSSPAWSGSAAIPELAPPSRLRATHSRGYARAQPVA